MLSTQYLETARTLFCVARNMADHRIADWLRALAEDYERRPSKPHALLRLMPQPRGPARPEFAEK
jgi:hypothetical protein